MSMSYYAQGEKAKEQKSTRDVKHFYLSPGVFRHINIICAALGQHEEHTEYGSPIGT
jgi:hypothetical protein